MVNPDERRYSIVRGTRGSTLLAVLRRDWAQLWAALGSLLTIVAVFQPWLAGNAPDGKFTATAFGRLQISESLVWLWSRQPPAQPTAAGKWGIVAAAAAVVTIAAVTFNAWAHSKVLVGVVAGTTLGEAICVITTMTYLNRIGETLRDRLDDGAQLDMGTQAGMWLRALAGTRSQPVPGAQDLDYFTSSFTYWAVLTGVVSVTSATAVTVQWFLEHRKSIITHLLSHPVQTCRLLRKTFVHGIDDNDLETC